MTQQCETCSSPTFCADCKQDRVVVTTPITRAFDAKNADGTMRHIIVGYGVLLNELDDFGTALSRKLVESSIPLLRKYPAVRLMHKEPFGHIVFDETIDGYSTHLDGEGFFVVAEIGAQFEKEFSLIKRGGWGFSWGMFPSAPPVQKKVGDKTGLVYEKGRVYEISVVDVPAQSNASITVLRGASQIQPRQEGVIGMIEAALGSRSTEPLEPEPETETPTSVFRSMIQEARGRKQETHVPIRKMGMMTGLLRQVDESQFPEKCNPELCPKDIARWCRANTENHFGQPCIYRTEKNR